MGPVNMMNRKAPESEPSETDDTRDLNWYPQKMIVWTGPASGPTELIPGTMGPESGPSETDIKDHGTQTETHAMNLDLWIFLSGPRDRDHGVGLVRRSYG